MNTKRLRNLSLTSIRSLTALLLSLALGTVIVLSAPREENILANPGFEVPDPANWETKDGNSPGLWAYSWFSSPVHGGNHSVGIAINLDAYNGWWQSTPPMPITATTRYAFSGWVKSDGVVNQAFLTLSFLDANSREILVTNSSIVNGSIDWVQVHPSVSVVAPIDAVSAFIRCQLAGRGTAWFDDIILVPYDHTVYLPQAAKNHTHPLCNGDFEMIDGDFSVCWEREGDLSVSIPDTLSNGDPCYSGSYCAFLGSPDYPCNRIPLGYGRLHQTFGVPFTGMPMLSFRYRIFSYDELNSDKFDSFDVYIDDILPDEIPPILILRDGSTDGEYGCDEDDLDITNWKESPQFDLSAIPDGYGGTVDYRGKTVRLSFYNYSREADPRRTVGWFNTWVYVDDVRIQP